MDWCNGIATRLIVELNFGTSYNKCFRVRHVRMYSVPLMLLFTVASYEVLLVVYLASYVLYDALISKMSYRQKIG